MSAIYRNGADQVFAGLGQWPSISDGTRPQSVADDATMRYTRRGSIANAAVRTLNATPVTVIAAPGAGKFIRVIRAHWWLDYTAPAFDAAAAGEDLALKYTDASGAQVAGAVDHDGFGNASADAHQVVVGVDVTPVANAAIVAHLLSGEWYGAAGGSALKYEIEYEVCTLDFAVS